MWEHKDLIASKVNANSKYVCTFSVTREDKFTFPEGASGNTVSFYMAIGYDKIAFVLEQYDVYMTDNVIGGNGISYEHRYNRQVTKRPDVPKRVLYSIVDTAG